jgi:hypothetical protein
MKRLVMIPRLTLSVTVPEDQSIESIFLKQAAIPNIPPIHAKMHDV